MAKPMTQLPANRLFAVTLLATALVPTIARRWEARDVMHRLDALVTALPQGRQPAGNAEGARELLWTDLSGARARDANTSVPETSAVDPDPALFVRVEETGTLLATWQTIGGCGSSGATGSAGIKWIGRSATGGLFNVQVQANYSELGSAPYKDHNLFLNTLITRDITPKWNFGVNVPYVYKYFDDPFMQYSPQTVPPTPALPVSNAGLGDVSMQGTHKFGSINDTSLTLVLGLPTGTYTVAYPGHTAFGQQRQLGFGKITGAAIVDHTIDQIWGVIVLGGVAAYRGGQNSPLENYRAPSATGYGYAGYFWGPFVPACGLTLTGFTKHDRDKSQEENSALFVAAANFSLEWSTDWVALLAGVQFPYQYDGVTADSNGVARSPWGWGPWLVALGVAVSPF
jgi:hypothetical protein